MSIAHVVADVTQAWAQDPDSDVVWAGDFEGRRGVRMRQTVRDFTTVWFRTGERTVQVEAYVIPLPAPDRAAEVFALCLVRNRTIRRVHFAIDRDDGIVLTGRIPLDEVDRHELELVLGEVYDLVETSFRPLVRLGFGREKRA